MSRYKFENLEYILVSQQKDIDLGFGLWYPIFRIKKE